MWGEGVSVAGVEHQHQFVGLVLTLRTASSKSERGKPSELRFVASAGYGTKYETLFKITPCPIRAMTPVSSGFAPAKNDSIPSTMLC